MRIYLDWNATAPLRVEARRAMRQAMDLVGNPSSVHAEGRAAKGVVERARAQVAEAFGAEADEVVFTSGATEAAALALARRGLRGAGVEHDAVHAWISEDLDVSLDGRVRVRKPSITALQVANSETGVIQDLPDGIAVTDATQAFGKLPVAFSRLGADMALASAHKLGGPKGTGALLVKRGMDLVAQARGGGQEMGRRSGTENVIGIAGFGAAAQAAARDLANGVWERVGSLRNILENALETATGETIFIGYGSRRLPNTLCFAAPGWNSQIQVMQMDLEGFAVSAGSACSSGKVRASRVLAAMGFDEAVTSSALRVSLGPGIRKEEVLRFADTWLRTERRFRTRVG